VSKPQLPPTSPFEHKLCTDIIYLDLKKAFDSVPHNELLFKLWRIGITGKLWSWFKAYLSHRQHFVCYKDASSTSLPVLSGVPQGSVLGPLLFLVYINDIPSSINFSTAFLFADDAKLLNTLRSNLDTIHLQDDVNSIGAWSEEWKVKLNAIKCVHVHFSMQGSDPTVNYRVNNTTIQCSSVFKDLGVMITPHMSWSIHISRICSHAYRSLHIIKRNIPQVPP